MDGWKSKWALSCAVIISFLLILGVSNYYRQVNVLHVPAYTSYRPVGDDDGVIRQYRNEHDEHKEEVSHSRPHILFILIDDLGYNDVGYHNSKIRSPTIDRLARTGVRLENYYVANMCSPSRAQLMTGRYQSRTGIFTVLQPQWDACLPLNEVTIAEVLRNAGYSTHLVGKWHLGHSRKECTPTHRGFDTFLGFLSGSEDHYTHTIGWQMKNGKGQSGYDFYENERVAYEYKNQYSTHIYSRRTIDLIEQHNTMNISKPLFLFLSIQAVHTPIEVPDEYIQRNLHIENPDRRTYVSMVTCVDDAIKNITETLKKHDMWKNTLVIFSTDNGGPVRDYQNDEKLLETTGKTQRLVSSNWPLRGGKGTHWEGGVRGAAFVHSPLLKPEVVGTENRELMSLVDWLPTLAGHLGGGNIQNLRLDGFNIWDTIREGKESPRTELLHDVRVENDRIAKGSIRVGSYKLCYETGGRANHEMIHGAHIRPYELDSSVFIKDKFEPKNKTTWLFNIEEDPLELNDLSDKMPEKTRFLKERLTSYSKFIAEYKPPKEDPNYSPAKLNMTIGPWL